MTTAAPNTEKTTHGFTISLPPDLVNALAKEVGAIARELAATEGVSSPWLDVEDAAVYLATTPQAVRAAIKRGQLPGKRPNGRVMFTRSELDRYVIQGHA